MTTHQNALSRSAGEWITIPQAARLMDRSAAFVAMLADASSFEWGSPVKGVARVSKSSVLKWVAENPVSSDVDYRKAAADAGMYDIDDAAYVCAGSDPSARPK